MLLFQIALWMFIILSFLLAYSFVFVNLRNDVILEIKNKKFRNIGKYITFFISYGGIIYTLYEIAFDGYTMKEWIIFNVFYLMTIIFFITIIVAFAMLYKSYKSKA